MQSPRPTTSEADRAALLVVERKAGEALDALDRVLADHPNHPQALFNRALALRDLGLPLAAAEAFDKVAALGEPGWSDEAKARAAALRAEHDARRDAWSTAKQAGLTMTGGGAIVPDAIVRSAPDLARHYLYHSVRAASSRARVLSLAPLAQQLDSIAGGHVLADWVASVGGARLRDPARRSRRRTGSSSRARRRASTRRGRAPTSAAPRGGGRERSPVRRHGAGGFGSSWTRKTEYAPREGASGDPVGALALGERMFVAKVRTLLRGDYSRAELTLRRGVAACLHAHVDWRCAQLEFDLSALLDRESRTSEARGVALSGLARSRVSAYEM